MGILSSGSPTVYTIAEPGINRTIVVVTVVKRRSSVIRWKSPDRGFLNEINLRVFFILVFLLPGCTVSPGPGGPTGSEAAIPTETVAIQTQPQRLRVTNQGVIPLYDLVVIFPNQRIEFGDVPAGATTGYQVASHGVYRYAAYKVELDGRKYTQPVIDWVGETPMQGEAFTYILEADPSRWETEGQVIRLVEVVEGQAPISPGTMEKEIPTQTAQLAQRLIQVLTPTPTEVALPTLRETPLQLPVGLTVEEYALEDRPSFEPLSFSPIQGSQAGVRARRELERRQNFPDNSFFDHMHFSGRASLDGAELVAFEDYNQGGSNGWLTVERNGEEIYQVSTGPGSPLTPLQGLWVYDDHWVLETAFITRRQEGNTVYTDATGRISQDGELLNDLYDYEEMFGFQLMAGRPFYFFKRDGKIGFSYDGQAVEAGYDEIPHYGCCSAAGLNPIRAQSMVAFFAQRDGIWYYVEVGVYE